MRATRKLTVCDFQGFVGCCSLDAVVCCTVYQSRGKEDGARDGWSVFLRSHFPMSHFYCQFIMTVITNMTKKIDLRRTNACSFLPSQRRRRNQAKQFFLILQVTSTFFASVKTFLLTNILCCKSYYGPRALLPSHFHVLRGTLGPRWEKASCDLFIDVQTEIGTLDIQSPLSPCATSHFLSNGQREHSYWLTTCDICRRSILEEQQYVLHLLTK